MRGGDKITKYWRCFYDSASILYKLNRGPILIITVATFLMIPIIPLELWLIKTLVDDIQNWSLGVTIVPILKTAVWLALLMMVNNVVLGAPVPIAMTRLNELSTLEEQRLILQKTTLLPYSEVESPRIKDLRARALHVSLYQICVTHLQLLQNIIQVAVLISIMLAFGQWIPVVAVCVVAFVQTVVFKKVAERLELVNRRQTQPRRLLQHYADLMTKRDAAKEIRLFALGGVFAKRWVHLYDQQSRETWKVTTASEFLKLGPNLLMAMLSGLMIALLVLLPGASKLSAGDFTLLFMALTMLFTQLSGFVGQFAEMRTQYMRWEDFRTYLDLEEASFAKASLVQKLHAATATEQNREEYNLTNESPEELQVRNLRFRYPNTDHDTLSDISFAIPSGCRIALVGENGSGKSTLIKLLTGLYIPDDGEILWKHGGIRGNGDGSSDEPNRRVSAVFQDFTRLYLTLRENVALGQLAAMQQDQHLENTLKSAGSQLLDLETRLGTPFGGIEPSGGEWQKIATARAMLGDSSFIFFDEPTAALDPQAEKEAFEQFLLLTEARSALLVTHRLGAAKMADLIFVLKNGSLAEKGTHDELLQRGGEYSRMFHLQASWYV